MKVSGVFSVTLWLLCAARCSSNRVYFDCGARVDMLDVQGLILSPGFPYNYSSGTHCIWQFFVPPGLQLTMDMFDFDVFESHAALARRPAVSEDDTADEEDLIPLSGVLRSNGAPSSRREASAKETQAGTQVVVIQEKSTKMEMAKISNSVKRPSDSSSGGKMGYESGAGMASSTPSLAPTVAETDSEALSGETQPDACPHDVLYISDLTAFSSRFCGSRRPSGSQLVFGSDAETVEVIMELITTTHWGRGFALLFRYRNRTQDEDEEPEAGPPPPVGGQRSLAPSGGSVDVLLASISGAAFFAMALASVLCLILRPKLCAKGSNTTSSIISEVPDGLQNSGADAGELQLVSPSNQQQELVSESEHNLSVPHTGSSISGGCDVSQNAELQCSEGLTELELGTDEVFVISPAPNTAKPTFSPHTQQRERFLRHSDTGAQRPAEHWSTEPTSGSCSAVAAGRPRAWSVRTLQDFLPPLTLPQIHKKWCSWNSTSPFTKLLDTGSPSSPSDTRNDVKAKVLSECHLPHEQAKGCRCDWSMSTASYPLSHSAQRQRRLNSTSNLRRPRFTSPCFGLLPASSEPSHTEATPNLRPHDSASSPSNQQQQNRVEPCGGSSVAKGCNFSAAEEEDHITVPVFAISEEDDRQPLVLAEHQVTLPHFLVNGQSYECPKVPKDVTPTTTETSSLCLQKMTSATAESFTPQCQPEQSLWGDITTTTPTNSLSSAHSATPTGTNGASSGFLKSALSTVGPPSHVG